MARPVRLLVAVGILAAAAYGADRVAAHVAANKIAAVVQSDAHLADRPHVTVKGFPFLTQVVKGRYGHIDVTASDLFGDAARNGGAVLHLDFAGVQIPASKALRGEVVRIPVQQVTGSATVPFADLQSVSHVPGLSSLAGVPDSSDEIALSEQISVGGVDVAAQLTAVVAVDGGVIVVTPRDLALANGVPVPAAVTKSVLAHAAFSVRLPGLPSGVSVTGVRVTPDGISITVRAGGLVLTR